MRGKVFKRITAALMALAMVGTTLPADIGGFQLFGGSVMTADAVDAVTYNLYNWNTETNKLDYTEKTVSSYNELTAEYLKERKYTLNGITASGEGGKVYISGGKMEITLRNSNSDGRRGNEAIGAGANDSKSGSVYIHNNNNEGDGNSYMRVSYQDNDKWVAVKAGDRSGKLHSHKNIKVEPCDNTDGNSKSGWSYTVNKDDNVK